MDALGDNDNSNDIPFEQNPASQVIQSETLNSKNNSVVSTYNKLDMNISDIITQENQVDVRNTNSAIVIPNNDISDTSGTTEIEEETVHKKGIKHESISSQGRSTNLQARKENTVKPSFFELSRSAQKLGFFAKKRRQRNQTSTLVVNEEVPPKKVRKSVGKLDKSSKTRDSKAKKSITETNIDSSSGDKNNNFTNVSVKVETDYVYQENQQKIYNDSVDKIAVKSKKLSGSCIEDKLEMEEMPQNELHIKIEDIRSGASDIYYGTSAITGIIDKPSVDDGNDSDPDLSAVDKVSSDSETSQPDVFSSDTEERYTEMEAGMDDAIGMDHAVGMDENPDLMEANLRLGGGGFIIESQVCDGRKDSNVEMIADIDTTLTNENNEQEFGCSSKPDRGNQNNSNRVTEESNKINAGVVDKATSNDSVTPKSEKTSGSKSSPLMNAFSILMQKGKSLSNKLLNRKSTTQTERNAMDILMSNSGKQDVQKEVKPKREWSLVQSEADEEATNSGTYNCTCTYIKQ